MPKIIFKVNDQEISVDANVGDTLLDAANNAGVQIFGGCGGAGVCGTCHVVIDPESYKKIMQPSFEELDLIEVIPNTTVNSRLACQIIISEDMDGMIVFVP